MVDVMKKALALLALVTAAVLAASGAHAFTFENGPPDRNGGGSLVDPGDQVKSSGSPGTATREGGSDSRFQFSVGPSSGSAFSNRPNTSPPAWVGNPLYLDKGGQ
jgi:hypothetical protein